MARYPKDTLDGPYRVELAVRVWRQLDALAPDAVQRLHSGLARIAREVSADGALSPAPQTFDARFDDLEITYQLSGPRRTVTLLSVTPVSGEAR